MTELEIIQRAKMYMEKLANGVNPIDGTDVAEDDVVNNVRISRCLFFVADVLGRVIENGGITSPERRIKQPFALTEEELKAFQFSDSAISVSEIAKRLNALIDENVMKKISYKQIRNWLQQIGMLEDLTVSDGKTVKRPTEVGNSIGITLETRQGRDGTYRVVLYDRGAQQFVVDNLQAILTAEDA